MPAVALPGQFSCNTCGGIYSATNVDGSTYFHACPDVTVPGAQPNPLLPGFTPPTFTPRPNKRDENVQAGLLAAKGQFFKVAPDPLDPLKTILVPVPDPTLAQGLGRTQH